MTRPIQREAQTKNQHAIAGMWKAYCRDDLKKRLGRGPKPEAIAEHRATFLQGIAAGMALIVKPLTIGCSREALAQWIDDLAFELKEEARS